MRNLVYLTYRGLAKISILSSISLDTNTNIDILNANIEYVLSAKRFEYQKIWLAFFLMNSPNVPVKKLSTKPWINLYLFYQCHDWFLRFIIWGFFSLIFRYFFILSCVLSIFCCLVNVTFTLTIYNKNTLKLK